VPVSQSISQPMSAPAATSAAMVKASPAMRQPSRVSSSAMLGLDRNGPVMSGRYTTISRWKSKMSDIVKYFAKSGYTL
jgi:hypothetical protein